MARMLTTHFSLEEVIGAHSGGRHDDSAGHHQHQHAVKEQRCLCLLVLCSCRVC